MTAARPASEAFTIFMPAAGWTVELLTTAEEVDYMTGAYLAQRGRRPGVAMCPATWAIVGELFQRLPDGRHADLPLRVMLSDQHDPATITFFDDDLDTARSARLGTS